ncbi:MAG: TolC family protein [Planctomycetia bacterium]|nr:TolC family protein [Planctomycetia bacterium]
MTRRGRTLAVASLAWTLALAGACATPAPSGGELRRRALHDASDRTGVAVAPDAIGAAAADALAAAPLTDANAVRLAVLAHPSVRAALARLGVTRADLVQAGLISNPVFAADAIDFSGRPELEFALAQPFLDLFLRPLRARVASAELAATEAAVARDLVHLAFEVRRALAEVRAADRLTSLRRDALATATSARELVERLHAAGSVSAPERTLVEDAELRARLALLEAEAAAEEARETVAALFGDARPPPGFAVPDGPRDELPALDLGDVEARAWRASLDGREAEALLDAAVHGRTLAGRRAGMRTFELGAVARREPDATFGAGPAVALTVPILDHGQAASARADAVVAVRAAERDALRLRVESTARRLRGRVRATGERAALLRDRHLPLRARFVRETLQRYDAMQVGAFDALAAKREELEAQQAYVATLRTAWLARLDLEELLAGSLVDLAHATPIDDRASPPQEGD